MNTKPTKLYSPAYWTKHALRYQSNPETLIAAAVRGHTTSPGSNGIAFEGTAHELLNILYTEHRKNMKCVHWGLFPTPMDVARRLANLLDLQPHHTVFDPGAGLGNLLLAASERGARAHGMEFQQWLYPLITDIGIDVIRGDFLDYPLAIRPFDCVMVNPPFGKIGNSPDATTDFMARLADISPRQTTIGAILPSGHFSRGNKKRMATADRFTFYDEIPLDSGTFKPLTNVATSIHLMAVN